MEFLKELFAAGALTFEQFAEAAQKAGFQLVNAAGGAYVPKADVDALNGQITTLNGQLTAANQKLEGYDPNWKTQAENDRKALDAQKLDFAIEKGLAAAGARSTKALRGFLDTAKLSLTEDGALLGLDAQLAALKKGEDTAFLFAEDKSSSTGMSHQGGTEGAGGGKEEANAALRALFH